MVGVIIATAVIGFILYQIWFFAKKRSKRKLQKLSPTWRSTLLRHVAFYKNLSPEEQKSFERSVQAFLAHTSIRGIGCEVEELDRLLIASAAIIPLFAHKVSVYPNLDEVLLYADHFNRDYQIEGNNRSIMGMVGNRHLHRSMILAKPSLRTGFDRSNDGRNTAIHEFVHLIDAWDGEIDGIPEALMEQPAVGPWMELIRAKMKAIKKGNIRDINPYAASGPEEFLAVTSEYFLENPKRLQKKHPKLHRMLKAVFRNKTE